MDTPETTKPHTRLLRAYGFSLAFHAAVIGGAVLLMVTRKPPAIAGNEMIFSIEPDAVVAETPVSPPLAIPEPNGSPVVDTPTPVADAQVAGTAAKNTEEPKPHTLLLSELLKAGVPTESVDEPVNEKPFEPRNWLEQASAKTPMVMVSNSTAPAVDPMDSYFTVFVQSLRDVYEKPEELARQQQQLSVRIRYEIAADGTIGTVSIVRSSGSSAYDQSVLKAFRSIASIGPRPDLRGSVNVADFCLIN